MRVAAFAAALTLIAGAATAQAPQAPRSLQPSPALQAPQAGAAQPPHMRRTFQERFDAANTTHDGHLTLEQARAGRMVAVARDFAAIDTTQKGYVTADDIKAHRHAMRLARKAAKPS